MITGKRIIETKKRVMILKERHASISNRLNFIENLQCNFIKLTNNLKHYKFQLPRRGDLYCPIFPLKTFHITFSEETKKGG